MLKHKKFSNEIKVFFCIFGQVFVKSDIGGSYLHVTGTAIKGNSIHSLTLHFIRNLFWLPMQNLAPAYGFICPTSWKMIN